MNEYVAGSTSIVDVIFFQDSTKTDGSGKTVVYNDSGLTCYYKRSNGTASVIVSLANITTLGTFVSGGLKAIDSTNMIGAHEFHPPNAAFVAGAKEVTFWFQGSTGLATRPIKYRILAVDPDTAGANGIYPSDAKAINGDTTAAANGALAFNGTGYFGATAPAQQQQLSFISISGGPNAVAAAISITTGTETGTFSNTSSLDGVYDQVAQSAGTIDFYYQFNLSGTTGAMGISVDWYGYVAGAVNTIKVYAYNWGNAAWDQIGSIPGIAGTVNGEQEWDITTAHTGTGGNAGLVRIRFNGTGLTAASVFTDRILLSYVVMPLAAASFSPPTNWSLDSIDSNGRRDIIKINGTSQTARDIGASVLLSAGTSTGQLDFTSGIVKSNSVQWLGGTIPAVNVTGVPQVDVQDIAGATVSTTTAQIGVKVINTASNAFTSSSFATNSFTSGQFAASFYNNVLAVATGTASAGGASTITLSVGSSTVDHFYEGCQIRLTGGTGFGTTTGGQVRTITGYVGSTLVATVDRTWTTNPDATTTYAVQSADAPKLDSSLQTTAGSVQGNVTGSVAGNVGGNVVGSVASVTGAVGSVTGNVGGNVVGSVGSVVSGVTLAASQHVIVDSGTITTLTNLPAITANWFTATGIDATAVTKLQAGLSTYSGGAVASVTGNIGGNIAGDLQGKVIGGGASSITGTGAQASLAASQHVIADSLAGTVTLATSQPNYAPAKAGDAMTLTATGLDAIAATDPGPIASWTTFPKKLMGMFRSVFNKNTLTASQMTQYQDDGTTTAATSVVSDNGTTQTKNAAS